MYRRLATSGHGALWGLSHKFGCSPGEAVTLLVAARAHGLIPSGLSVHVGSQQMTADAWSEAGELLALPCPAFSAPDLARPEPSGADCLARPGSPEADGAEVSSRNLHLHDLVIVPELRRRGLARNVLDRLIRTARAQGYERLSLVAVGGSDAFWSSCGFVAHPSVPVPDSYGRSARVPPLPLLLPPPHLPPSPPLTRISPSGCLSSSSRSGRTCLSLYSIPPVPIT